MAQAAARLPLAPAQPDDTLARAQAGDATAFAALVTEHQRMVFSLARHFTRQREAAEDLAQDVFIELYKSIGRLESRAHLVFWLRRVTSHRCIDRARREANRPELAFEALPERATLMPSPDLMLEDRLRRLVEGLAPAARLVVALRYQEDLDPQEIAQVLEMPVNTVKSHLRRSIEHLRGRLRPVGEPA